MVAMPETMYLAEIIIENRKRPADPGKVAALAASIAEVGLLQPVVVDERNKLIAGFHRYRALQKLGAQQIAYVRQDFADKLRAELAEIDENLIRNELTELQTSQWIRRREELIDKLGQRAPCGRRSQAPAEGDGKGEIVSPLRTTADLAAEIGLSERSYQQRKQIAAGLAPDVAEAIADTPLADSVTQLLELSRLPQEEQRIAYGRIEAGEARTVHEAIGSGKPHVSHNSGNNEWYTPPEYIEAARACMGSIDTDPASNDFANQHVIKAAQYFTAEQNGLKQEWRGNVWLNPPYGRGLIEDFAFALVEKHQAGEFQQAIVLVNNATETGFFQTLLSAAAAICLPKSRIPFLNSEGKPVNKPLQGQSVLYFGPHIDRFRANFAPFGAILDVWREEVQQPMLQEAA